MYIYVYLYIDVWCTKTSQGGPLMKPTWILTDLQHGNKLSVKMTKELKEEITPRLMNRSSFYRIQRSATDPKKISVSGTKNLGLTAKWPEAFCKAILKSWQDEI